jgi:hypothetical protein
LSILNREAGRPEEKPGEYDVRPVRGMGHAASVATVSPATCNTDQDSSVKVTQVQSGYVRRVWRKCAVDSESGPAQRHQWREQSQKHSK